MDKIYTIVWGVGTVIVVAIVFGSILFGCVNSNNQYYAAMKNCVDAGGSAIPTNGNNGTTFVCIHR
jgi:hypothetical protein